MRYKPAMRIGAVVACVGFGLLSAACSAPADEDESTTAEAEGALTAVRAGHYAIERAPSSRSHVASLTLKAGKKFELEYVRVRTESEPWIWNPWVQVPSTKKESFLLSGSYFTFAGDPGETLISFDADGGAIDRLIYRLERVGENLRLTAVGEPPFELAPAEASEPATDLRVVSCAGRRWTATFTFEDAERRRGTLKVKRKAGADSSDPPSGPVTIVFTGGTGVDDYMAFEGKDSAGGRYEVAFRRSELNRTSGELSSVGLGYSRPHTSYFMHNSLSCTIAAP